MGIWKLILALLVPIGIYAQKERSYLIEGGTTFNVKANKEFHIKDPGGSTTSFEYKGTIRSLPSYYIKGGLEKSYNLCPVSRISFPICLSYFNEAQNIKAVGGWVGCFGGEGGNYDMLRNNHFAFFTIGLKLCRNFTEKISVQNSINYNHNLMICSESKYKLSNESGTGNYYINQWLTESGIAFSVQSGIFYQTGKKTKIGLTGEYFFFDKRVLPSGKNMFVTHYDIYNFGKGYKGYSATINIGVRLQHSF